MKLTDHFEGTLTLTEQSSKELFRILREQDEKFINALLDGKTGFTLSSSDGRSVDLIPLPKAKADNCGECFGASFGDCDSCPKEEGRK